MSENAPETETVEVDHVRDLEVAALLAERESYAIQGLDDRIPAVDEQLVLRGHQIAATARAAAAPKGTKGRSPAPADTA